MTRDRSIVARRAPKASPALAKRIPNDECRQRGFGGLAAKEEIMLWHSRAGLEDLTREEQDFAQRVTTIIRRRISVAEAPDTRSADLFDAALAATLDQHNDVVWTRLADRSRVLSEAKARAREGKYGVCLACGCRIPRRRLHAMPTATLCVPCQAQRELACGDT